ncbi:MAG: rod shape-determining protein MreC [Saprospiraceae bacterium]|nr:rod shape-determining protein MreC [Saprospiraceae bacterium]
MRNLLEFLARFGSFFLFILLEAVCFFLIVRFDDGKNRIFLSSTNAVAGFALKQYDAIADYATLPREMKQLQEENSRLRAQLADNYLDPSYTKDTIEELVRRPDSIYSRAPDRDSLSLRDTLITQRYVYIPANVISNSINRRDNTLTIDRGTSQEVTPRMGVIGPQGIVGIVRTVSKNYASVLSILHAETSISASVKHKGYFGSLVWRNPKDPGTMKLEAIPKHAGIAAGDTIVTSGFSGMFPAGIFIGTVASALRDTTGDNFQDITVKLALDMGNVSHVYVVQNKQLEDLRKVQPEGGRQ